jgi:hypothetical protein
MRKLAMWANLQRSSNFFCSLSIVCLLLFVLGAPGIAVAQGSQSAADGGKGESGVSVVESFQTNEAPKEKATTISDHEKSVIMFIMGVALLIAVITTASLGLSMAIHGKDVFIAHMIGAGISVFLALAHSVVAIVWFFPFK